MRTLLVAFLAGTMGSTALAQVNLQYNGRYNGQYSGRVDGRGSKNEGLPPSAGDTARINESISQGDCDTLQTLNPSIRPGMQGRILRACEEQYPLQYPR